MKSIILLLILLPFVFGEYSQPPISKVVEHNIDRAQTLDGYYNASNAKNSTLPIVFGNRQITVNISADVDIAGPSLLIDNMTYPHRELSIIIARGDKLSHLPALPSEGWADYYCDRDWWMGSRIYPWRCDFDGDDCVEYENSSSVNYEMNITFTFKNESKSLPFESTLVPVPRSIREAMEDSSGSDRLDISLEGNVTFVYVIIDREIGIDCYNTNYTKSGSIPISINRSYAVGGVNKLFFLRSPVLREQWFRNNHFDVIVMSQSPIYYADISLNENHSKNTTIKNFSIVKGDYGIWQIVTNKTNVSDYVESTTNGTNILPLQEENHSFSFVYEFNYSYSGLGENNLSLYVEDVFLGSEIYKESINSRMLSYDGKTTERGESIENLGNVVRKSIAFKKDEISAIVISFGLLAIVVVLAFLNFWLRR